jgi:hypothetical protein
VCAFKRRSLPHATNRGAKYKQTHKYIRASVDRMQKPHIVYIYIILMNARRSGLHNATRLFISLSARERETSRLSLFLPLLHLLESATQKQLPLSRIIYKINPLVAPHQGSPDAKRVLRVTLTSGCCRTVLSNSTASS